MALHDRLPRPLRLWATQAALAWEPRSLGRAFRRALAAAGSVEGALERLDRAEAVTLGRDRARAAPAPPARPRQ